MANTYDVYIAEDMYQLLVHPNQSVQGRYLHLGNISESSLEHLKSVANEGDIAIAYMASEIDYMVKGDEEHV